MELDRPVREAEHRLASFNRDRDRLLHDVERRVQARLVERAAAGGEHSLEYVLNDVAFHELRRVGPGGGPAAERWRTLSRRLGTMSEADKRRELAGSSPTTAATSSAASIRACTGRSPRSRPRCSASGSRR
jgi:hypothetical protein